MGSLHGRAGRLAAPTWRAGPGLTVRGWWSAKGLVVGPALVIGPELGRGGVWSGPECGRARSVVGSVGQASSAGRDPDPVVATDRASLAQRPYRPSGR